MASVEGESSSSIFFGLACASLAPLLVLAFMVSIFPQGQGQALAAALVGYPIVAGAAALGVLACTSLLHLMFRRR